MSFEVSNNLMHTFVFTFSRLPRHPKNRFCTVFNTPVDAQFKNDKMCILGLKLGNALTKVWIGIIFVEIECDLVIKWYKVTFFITISEFWSWNKYIAFSKLLDLGCWKLYKTIFQGVLEAENWPIKLCIKSIETSLFLISNMVSSLHFCQ